MSVTIGRFLPVIDDERGEFKVEFFEGMAFLHVALKLPLEGMRAVRSLFPQVKAWLRAVGHQHVYVLIPEGDDKLYRFERHMGFEERRRFKGRILMRQEC